MFHLGGLSQSAPYVMRQSLNRLEKYYFEARKRAGRRKSPWNALLILLGLVVVIGLWYALFRGVWLFHIAIYPEHQLQEFWQEGISSRSFILSFLIVFALMPSAIVSGFMIVNFLLWMITPIRRIFERGAQSYSGTSFRESMSRLLKLGFWIIPIRLIISMVSAYLLKSLK